MNGVTRVYDCQQQLVRALDEGNAPVFAKTVSDVIKQLDMALEDLKFKRAGYWSPDDPDWKPMRGRR